MIMSERKINISDTLQYNLAILGININANHENYMLLLDAIKKVIGEALELAAENAYCTHEFNGAHGCEISINKQSILATIHQIE